jgi:hypothetical protein
MTELASNGQGPRKRMRHEGHIPVWGEPKWHPKIDEPRDGKNELTKARGKF